MKKILSLSMLLLIIASCSQLEELHLFKKNQDNEQPDLPCPTVSSDSIPALVASTFAQQYPKVTPALWCTDSSNYVAVFMLDSLETKAYISSDGNLLKEEVEIDQQGDYQDNQSDCECELPGKEQGED